MKKLLDKISKLIRTNKNYKLFFIIIVIISVIFGALFALIINSSDKSIVTDYLSKYFNQITSNKISFLDLFINNSVSYLLIIFLIWLLGISIIGLPINIF